MRVLVITHLKTKWKCTWSLHIWWWWCYFPTPSEGWGRRETLRTSGPDVGAWPDC